MLLTNMEEACSRAIFLGAGYEIGWTVIQIARLA